MRLGRLEVARSLWGIGLLALLAVGCREDLTAPGTCPEYCPAKRIVMFDSLFVGSVFADSAYAGYVAPHLAEQAQVVTDGASAESRAIIRFLRFSETIDALPVASTDSFQLAIEIEGRGDVAGLELVVHRLPADVDTTVTHAGTDAFFEDSTEIGVIAIPDTLTSGAVSAVLPGDAFPTFEADSFVTAVGLRISAGSETFVDVGALAGLKPAVLTQYAQLQDGDTTVPGSATKGAAFNSFVSVDQSPFDRDILGVGGSPAWRALLRVDLPSLVVDSSDVSRATLILVPAEPILGAAGDTLRLRADALTEDVGPKSPIVAPTGEARDTLSTGGLDLLAGSSDTVLIDVTHIIKPWRADTTAPHSIALWMPPEAASVGQARFWSSRSAAGAPALLITYIPLFPRDEP